MSAPAETGMAPGVYDGIPEDAYHADPALSSSGARRLLACPAKFAYEREHGSVPTRAMETGTAAHLAVLGVGPDVVVVDAPDWRTKAAREQRDAARADGAVPLLAAEYDQVQAMAEAVRQHPVAGPLFQPGDGRAEVSIWWTDPDTGVSCRARLDWLRNPVAGRRLIIPDYKKTVDASPAAIARSIANYGYHQQGDWYTEAVAAAGLAPDGSVFLLVFQEPTPPYVVTVAQIAPSDLMLAGAKNAAARQLFRDCTASGHWPGYADEPLIIQQPSWAQKRDEEWL
ncbi:MULTISPECIES: PD-(D/E)XK nuclease-like domain-containing protein [Streptomyces]|nr:MULTISPECIES: PD-(D/E)XK nuclease-like domain-containing protein [Streptomyces]